MDAAIAGLVGALGGAAIRSWGSVGRSAHRTQGHGAPDRADVARSTDGGEQPERKKADRRAPPPAITTTLWEGYGEGGKVDGGSAFGASAATIRA